MGNLTGSRFTLKVSLRYSPEPGETDFLCKLFRIVSGVLRDATDRVLRIGQVEIARNSTGGADADIWIHPGGTTLPHATGARLWIPGEPMDLWQDYLMYPTQIVHELGHYLFGLRDEYGGGTACVGDVFKEASLMEKYGWGRYTRWTDSHGDNFHQGWGTFFPAYSGKSAKFQYGQPSEFCHAGNHDPKPNHKQNKLNGHQPCWTYMANDANHHGIPYGLSLPAAAGPTTKKPQLPPAPACVELQPVERSLLILGPRDASLSRPDFVFAGASFWIDTARPGEQLGMTSGLGEPEPVFSSVPVDPAAQEAWRSSLRAQLTGRADESVERDAESLRLRLLDVARPGRVANQQAVLVASWLSAADVESVILTVPDLQRDGTRLHVVAHGDETELGLLAQAALVTGGSLVVVPSVDGVADLSAGLIAVAEQSRENAAQLAHIVTQPLATKPSPEGTDLRVEVEVSPGSSSATFGAAWNAAFTPEIVVLDPDGRPVPDREGVRPVRGDGYTFVQVDAPASGRWTVVASGAEVRAAQVRVLASEVNDQIRLDATVLQGHVRLGEPLDLRVRLRAPIPVPGATMSALVRTPDGHVHELEFAEHTGDGDDPQEAGTYTATFGDTQLPGVYAIEVEVVRREGRFQHTLDEYYAARPGQEPDRLVQTISVPEVRRRATLVAVADAQGRTERDPLAGYNPRSAERSRAAGARPARAGRGLTSRPDPL